MGLSPMASMRIKLDEEARGQEGTNQRRRRSGGRVDLVATKEQTHTSVAFSRAGTGMASAIL